MCSVGACKRDGDESPSRLVDRKALGSYSFTDLNFHDQVDPDRPETFEFWSLVDEDGGFLTAIEGASTDDAVGRNKGQQGSKRV